MKVKVTGMGIISSIGMTIEENYHSLQTLNSGISNIELVKGLNNEFIGGEIKIPNKKLAEILEIKNYDLIPRSVLLSLIAAKEAWGENKPNPNIRTAIVGATTVGGMDLTEQYFKKNKTIHCLKNHPCGTITNYLENYFRGKYDVCYNLDEKKEIECDIQKINIIPFNNLLKNKLKLPKKTIIINTQSFQHMNKKTILLYLELFKDNNIQNIISLNRDIPHPAIEDELIFEINDEVDYKKIFNDNNYKIDDEVLIDSINDHFFLHTFKYT